MKIGNYNVSVTNLAAKKGSTTPTGKVDQYSDVGQKTFGQYRTAAGSTTISYDIVEGLYKRTIMRRVIDKLAADATRLGYTVTYTNLKGEPHEKAKQIGDDIDRIIRRNRIKWTYRDRNVYGDAFLYKQIGASTTGLSQVQDVYGISPRNLNPVLTNNVLTGWQYQSTAKGQTIDLSLEEVIHIPRDPLTGKLFGDSLFESVLQVLNLILNSQLNSAIILDHFAIPLVHWLIDSKHDRRKTPLSEITSFAKRLGKLKVGADLITDSSITHEVVGERNRIFDFSPILDKLDDYFFATAGVPAPILGMPADNLSAITRQLQTYYDNVMEEQYAVMDELIYQLYWPEMVKAGIDDLARIDIVPNKPMIEQESRIWTWVKEAIAMNVITLDQGLNILGIPGKVPKESNGWEELLLKPQSPFGDGGSSPNFDRSVKNPKPKGTSSKKGSQSGTGV
jgi:hypothetical protein